MARLRLNSPEKQRKEASLMTWKLQTKAPEDFSSGAAIEGVRDEPHRYPTRSYTR
jgi:hypothetical protein